MSRGWKPDTETFKKFPGDDYAANVENHWQNEGLQLKRIDKSVWSGIEQMCGEEGGGLVWETY